MAIASSRTPIIKTAIDFLRHPNFIGYQYARNMVFDRETIYEKLWGYDGEGDRWIK